MDMRMSAEAIQKQTMSLNQLRSLEILAMDSMKLNEFLKNEYLENPLLDCSNAHTPERREDISAAAFPHTLSYEKSLQEAFDEEERDIPDIKPAAMRDYIMEQLPAGAYSETEIELFRYLADCLDDSGYFTMSVEEAAEGAGVSVSDTEKALRVLSDLEPAGIFSRDLRECLLKQLERKGQKTGHLWDIVDKYLNDIAEGNISKVSRGLGISTSEVRKAIEELVSLKPRPVNGLDTGRSAYIVPDIIFTRDSGEWKIRLNDRWTEDYHINDYYVEMMRSAQDPELKEYFRKKLERARQVLQNIAQRRKTVLMVCEEILKRQKEFFEGRGELKPLSMQQLGDSLGISTSTVSRAVKDKYIEYPAGVTEARSLFTGAAARQGKSDVPSVSAESAKRLIRELIAGEDKKKPLSDKRLSELLCERGVEISRRTVAKYREELCIKQSFDRKERG